MGTPYAPSTPQTQENHGKRYLYSQNNGLDGRSCNHIFLRKKGLSFQKKTNLPFGSDSFLLLGGRIYFLELFEVTLWMGC